MKNLTRWIAVCAVALFLLVPVAQLLAYEPMNVVAKSEDQQAAQRWIDYLVANEVMMNFPDPIYFDSIKNAKYITIMGGVDDADIRNILTDVIGADEVAAMSKPGAKKMYVVEDKYAQGQSILVFTGENSEAAAEARTESRDEWMPLLEEWFDLDQGPSSLKAY